MNYLVKFQNGAQGVTDWCEQTGRSGKTFAHLQGVVLLALTEEERAKLLSLENVLYVEEDGQFICNGMNAIDAGAWNDDSFAQGKVGNAEGANVPKTLRQIFANVSAGANDGDCSSVRVAVLDTGVDSHAPGLSVAGMASFVDEEPSAEDSLWHGTWAAALVAANAPELGVIGVAPQAKIYAAKMMDRTGVGSFSQALFALEWAIEQQVDILLMAFGSRVPSMAMTELLEVATGKGILLVAAVGNDGQEGVNFPAQLPFVLGVGAVDDAGVAARFSNWGEGLDLLAPGVAIQSLYLFGNVFVQSGTSAAAALVAGAAALLKSRNPELTGPLLEKFLLDGCTRTGDLGVGLLNVHAALHRTEKYKQEETLANAAETKTVSVRDLDVGQSESACLAASEHEHVFRLVTTQEVAVEIELQVPYGHDFDFYVFDQAGRLLGLGEAVGAGGAVVDAATADANANADAGAGVNIGVNVGASLGLVKKLRMNAQTLSTYTIQVFGFGGDFNGSEPYLLSTRALATREKSQADFAEQTAQAVELVAGEVQRAALFAEFDVNFYKIALTAGQAVEIDLSSVPFDCQYDMELYDANGTCVTQARALTNRMYVLTFDSPTGGVYLLKVFSRQGFDANHLYTLHLDLYQALTGTVSGTRTLTAVEGPYLFGAGGLTVASNGVLTLEAGVVVSLRSPYTLTVQDGGELYLAGTLEQPVHLLGARTTDHDNTFVEIQWKQGRARVQFGYVNVQYDPAPQMVKELRRSRGEADLTETITEIPPSKRPEAVRQWYLPASPYQFSFFEPLALKKFELYFGMDAATFIQWEVDSRRICDEHFAEGIVNYWEFVNGHFTRDITEAKRIQSMRQTSSSIRVQRMIDYLQQGIDWVEQHGCLTVTKLWELLKGQRAKALYHHLKSLSIAFWWAHNSSIVAWDQKSREQGLEGGEDFYERAFLNGVILRLDFTTDLPFNLPVYGNNIPPIGWLGLYLTRGSFQYPSDYPAPKPPDIPSDLIDYHDKTTLQILKAYCEFMLHKGSSSVYTWWLPTPADAELLKRMQEKGLSLDSPDQDWKREFLDPQTKTLAEITRKYVRDPLTRSAETCVLSTNQSEER